MNIIYDGERLTQLMANLHALTGIRVSILREDGERICASGDRMPFCARIHACSEGRDRCRACELRVMRESSTGEGIRFYRCHAGMCKAILPILSLGQRVPLAWLSVGEYLDDAPLERQWERSRASLDWFPGDPDALRPAFLRFRRLSSAEQTAYAGILEALADYIPLKGLIRAAGETDLQKLERYIDAHYMDKLSLASVSAQLHIGRTRLCALAKELSGGRTLFQLIAQRRIDAAKALLIQSDSSISAVAEAVGINDYNYFSKIFRTATGTSPSEFRKQNRYGSDSQE